MGKRRWLAAGGSVLAATIGLLGASTAASASTASAVVGYTYINGNTASGYSGLLPGGHLLAAKGSPFTGQGLGQLGAEFSPANPSQLFVSNAHNGAGLGTVSAYRDTFFGNLLPVGSSPYADGQTAPVNI